MHKYCRKNSKINITSKQFFAKISTGQGQQWIVLNPFLDSLCNLGFKNIGLPPGVNNFESFPGPQNAVNKYYTKCQSRDWR